MPYKLKRRGQTLWRGQVRKDGKLYIASGEFVFCADPEGTVIWKADIENDGSLVIDGGRVTVKSGGKTVNLDADNGKRM